MRSMVLYMVMATVAVGARSASGAETPAAELTQLLRAIRDARAECHLPTEVELSGAKSAALAACERLAARLADAPDGKIAAEQLQLPELLEALQNEGTDAAVLERADKALHRNRPGTKGVEFDRVRSTVEKYLRLLRASQTDDLPQQTAQQIDLLEQALRRYAADRSDDHVQQVSGPFLWLWDHGQIMELLVKVHKQTVHTNHRMRFSDSFLNRVLAQPITEPVTSNEMNEGARVIVRGTLNGKLSSVLVPHESQGVIHVSFEGLGKSNISAYKGKATVRGRGQTNIHASQPVYLTTSGFRVGTPQSRVSHRTTGNTVNVQTNCRWLRPLMNHIAAKVVSHQQAENDCKAAQRTRRQVEERLKTESARMVKEGNQTIDSFGLFAALGPEPESRLRLRTTTEYLEWLGRYAGDRQFGAPAGPPEFAPGNHAVLFQAHESAINNAQQFVVGETVNDADFRELVYSTLGLVPIGDEQIAGRIPATITFAEENPLDVRFRDGQVFVKLRLVEIADDHLVGRGLYTVSTSYIPRTGPEGTKIVRNSPIKIEPADTPEIEKLQEILSRFLVPEADPGNMESLQAFFKPDKLRLHQLKLIDGWLTLVLDLEKGVRRD
ncbi:MAG TPA: hypothetical protein VFI31_15440 [Pirellulales bacterium]|nr:hypothetical protein [Pirellulales bacterium]